MPHTSHFLQEDAYVIVFRHASHFLKEHVYDTVFSFQLFCSIIQMIILNYHPFFSFVFEFSFDALSV